MKTLVDKHSGVSIWIHSDHEAVEFDSDFIRITGEREVLLFGRNSDNTLEFEGVTPPPDWVGLKYIYANGGWSQVADWGKAEAERLVAETAAAAAERLTTCQAQRAAEYPPMADYLDGIVKGDQAQVQAYIDACLVVKSKYPKSE